MGEKSLIGAFIWFLMLHHDASSEKIDNHAKFCPYLGPCGESIRQHSACFLVQMRPCQQAQYPIFFQSIPASGL